MSTGDMLRAAAKVHATVVYMVCEKRVFLQAGSEAGKTADPLMKSGQLVPDEIVVECVRVSPSISCMLKIHVRKRAVYDQMEWLRRLLYRQARASGSTASSWMVFLAQWGKQTYSIKC